MNMRIDMLYGFHAVGLPPRPMVWNGIAIVESINVPGRKVFRRERGGYLNRWLIRVEAMHYDAIMDGINNRIYVHPSQMPALRKAMGLPRDRRFDIAMMSSLGV